MPENHEFIQGALTPLVGLPLRCLGHAADLLWVHFGAMREITGRDGKTRTVGGFALHIQSDWRLARPPLILLGRGDLFSAAEGNEPYDWDAEGESRFDRLAAPLNQQFERASPRVVSITVNPVGGFILQLEDGLCLETFPAESEENNGEQWRLFQPGTNLRHFVVET